MKYEYDDHVARMHTNWGFSTAGDSMDAITLHKKNYPVHKQAYFQDFAVKFEQTSHPNTLFLKLTW
uniref:Uncharacterized protein n=1 Tax=Romanomermis culicivorax TaxID=13658 RepID=A0A915I5M9_ROMCU